MSWPIRRSRYAELHSQRRCPLGSTTAVAGEDGGAAICETVIYMEQKSRIFVAKKTSIDANPQIICSKNSFIDANSQNIHSKKSFH
jgi:hypothetical protein